MKTNKLAGLLIALITLITFSAKAQNGGCSDISNESNCSVDVTISVYTLQGGLCTNLCTTYNTTIPPMTMINVNCACGNACFVQVTITAIGGFATTGTTDSNTFTAQPIGSVCCGCVASRIEYGNLGVGGRFKIK